jgi:hypothetical protein
VPKCAILKVIVKGGSRHQQILLYGQCILLHLRLHGSILLCTNIMTLI